MQLRPNAGSFSAALLAVVALPSDAVADRAFGPRFTVNTQGEHHDRGQLDRVLPGRAARLRERPRRRRRDAQQQRPDDDVDRRRQRSGDVRLELRRPDAASWGEGAVRGAVLRRPADRGDGRLAAAEPGRPQHGPLQGAGRHELSLRDGVQQVDTSSTQYQGFVNVTAIVDGAGAGTYWTANVQLGTGLSDSQLRRLGAGRRLRGPGCSEPQPLGVRRNAERQRAGTVTIPLSGFQTPLSARSRRRSGSSPTRGIWGRIGDGAAIQGPSGAFTALSNAVNPGPPATSASNSNVFNSTISNAGCVGHVAHAELPEQPRLRRRPVQDDERARQRADEHAGQALDQRRRLPAGCGDDRHRPVRAQDHRDEDRR